MQFGSRQIPDSVGRAVCRPRGERFVVLSVVVGHGENGQVILAVPRP